MSDETPELLTLALRLAREAGAIQRERFESPLEIRSKSAAIDLVTEVDHACEEHIVSALQRERPADAIVAEEGRGDDHAGAEWRWVIDPLDGTTNYAHGYPRFCVSIGVERRGEACIGVVFDPLLGELYAAQRGRGATRNGAPIRVSAEARIGNALVATGFPYDLHQTLEDNLDHFVRVVKSVRAIRRDGSAALDLCYVACGRLDAFWELKLKPWDVVAGRLIVEEAGGRVTNLQGAPAPRDGRETLASNGKLHEAMRALLSRPPAGIATGEA